MPEKKKTAGELSQKCLRDNTKYDSLEVGHAMADDIYEHLKKCIEIHIPIIDENEFCVVMIIAKDPIIKNLIRRKFYCWPYLPSPRPNQSVFLYNKSKNQITKRLWVLPCDVVMAELAGTNIIVDQTYQTMQAWSVAFFKGTFWDYIRHEHNINMLSETEYILENREKLIQAGCKIPNSRIIEPFDFGKIHIDNIVDTKKTIS